MKRFRLLTLLLPATIFCCRVGYAQQVDSIAATDTPLTKRVIELEELEVLSDMAKYKRDSALRRTIYKKALKDAAKKTEKQLLLDRPGEIGISLGGGVSELAMWVSGEKKKLRKFSGMLEADERSRFTSIRYNAGIVSTVMSIGDSAAIAFIASHPIPNDFVRVASDLEIKMWIRGEFKKGVK